MDKRSGSRSFPGWDAVYWLGQAGERTFRASIDYGAASSICVLRGEARLPGPARARWAMGSTRPGPVVWTRHAAPVLLSDDLVQVLRREGFSGWDTYPAELLGKEGDAIPGYQGLVITGRCGALDNGRSTQLSKVFPGGTFSVWKGLFFDEASWDGSDFFMPEGDNGWRFVVERVVKAFAEVRVKNVDFTPMSQVERHTL